MTDQKPLNGLNAERKKSSRGKTLTGRTVSGALWTSAGAGAEYILHGIIFVILARLLSPEDFGIYALATVVVGLSRVFGEVGLGPALVQRRELEDSHIRAAFTATLVLSLATTSIIATLAPFLGNIMGNSSVAPVIRTLSLLFVIRGFGIVAGFLLQRNMRLATLAKTNVLSYLIGYGFVGVPLAYYGLGYWALVIASLCETTVQASQVLFHSPHSKRLQFRWTPLKDLLSFGIGASVGRLGNYLAMKGDYLIVGRFLGVGALGIYSRAYELMAMPVGLYQMAAHKAFFSAVSLVQHEKTRLARAHCMTSALTALLLIPSSVGLCVLAPELIDVVLGERWQSVVAPFQVIAIGMFFRSGYAMSEALAKGTGHVHALALRQGIYAVLVIIGAWSGHHYGVIGVAAGVLCAIIVHFAMVTHLAMRSSGMTLREFLVSTVPGILLGGIVFIASLLSTTPLRTVGAPSWVTLLLSIMFTLGVLALVLYRVPHIMGAYGIWALGYARQMLSKRRSTPAADTSTEIAVSQELDATRATT